MAGGTMRRRLTGVAVLTLLVAATGCGGSDSSGGPSPSSTSASETASVAPALGEQFPEPYDSPLVRATGRRLQAELDGWVERGIVAGLTAAIVTDKGSWAGAAGVDDAGMALTPPTAMSVASVTKPFVAAEVMTLVEDGLVDLDAPISTYVSHPLTSGGATVREVLAMRSGILDVDESQTTVFAQDLERHWEPEETLALVTDPLLPGSPFRYSNASYLLLGLLIEGVTGRPLADALREDLFAPADLERIVLQDPAPVPAPAAVPGWPDTDGWPALPGGPYLPSRSLASACWAACGLAADALTIAKAGYLLYGGHMVEPNSVLEMTDTEDDRYGLGTTALETLDLPAVGHEGEIEGYRAILTFVPELTASIVVLVPYPSDPEALSDQLAKALGTPTGYSQPPRPSTSEPSPSRS